MLVINDSDVTENTDYRTLTKELKSEFIRLREGTAKNLYRKRLESSQGILDIMGGIDEEEGVGAVKQYFYGQNINFLISLFSTRTSEILAIFPGRVVTRIRTAAASALATDILSKRDSSVIGCIGAGYQASEQVRAMSQMRTIKRVMVSDLDPEKLMAFKRMVEEQLGVEAVAKKSVDESFREADIILTATNSDVPVIRDEFIGDSCYINSIGSYTPRMREIETSTICKSRIVAVDSLEETSRNTGELIDALSSGCVDSGEINEFTDLVTENIKIRRKSERESSYFKSIGVGIEDLTIAYYLYSNFS
ncbi:MAG: ornithine cyclodeaminase family protein [Candidatus Thermoplasmatota archaeon]|nr:ornithine cyclodeaminase family protein [Candidatus Thermoplasmatota archaeon]